MRLFGSGNGPYMASQRGLSNTRPDLLSKSYYQIVPSPRGLPMAQVNLIFQPNVSVCSNPDMTLAVLLDRSGSMSEAFREGHVQNVATAILNHVARAGVGYDLVFYDDQVSYAGHIRSLSDATSAISTHPPRGGTYVTEAIRGAISHYRKQKGIYLIVITDGEFADKAQVLKLVTDELLPQVTPDNPYAFRIHFVGAGEGVDHEFLRQVEAAASGQGVSLVTQHHHAHLSHSHTSILDELDKAFLGVGTNARFGEPSLVADSQHERVPGETITHVSEPRTRRTWDSGVGSCAFLPRYTSLGFEYSPTHGQQLQIAFQYQRPSQQTDQFLLSVPLPAVAAAAAPTPSPIHKLGFHLPWFHHDTPEEEAARTAETARREDLKRQILEVHQAEQVRQAKDLQALGRGGIPTQAAARLRELGKSDDEATLFTSNLSPEEAGLLRREGYRVRGMVSGSAVYHVGQAYASSQGDCEVEVLSDAYNTATELAVSRMRQELQLIDAHGVVGVRLSLVRHEWAEKTIEVQVMGTAIEGPGKAPADPWMCDLSGQEWWALHRAGYEPAALVWGHCTWFVLTSWDDEQKERSWYNTEITHWSHALGTARKKAMQHVLRLAKQHHATGVAGVRIERRLDEIRLTGPGEDPAYEREHHNLVMSIIGTAIRLRPDAPVGVQPTVMVLSLRDGRISTAALGAQDATIE